MYKTKHVWVRKQNLNKTTKRFNVKDTEPIKIYYNILLHNILYNII